MRRTLTTSLLALGTVAGSLAIASPASAHGYISSPPSRQAQCAAGTVAGCGQIQFEPQSVEGPKGLSSCDAGIAGFSALSDNSKAWKATAVGSSVRFSWVLTARHRTSTWQYFVGSTKVAEFNDGGAQPAATVSHTVDLSRFKGRVTVLAVWNIADTVNAFYNCVDLNVGGAATGGGSTTPPAAPASPSTKPAPASPAASPTKTATATPTKTSGATTWKTWTAYKVGDKVTFDGVTYTCRQSHTTLPGWEPPLVLALWLPVQ